MMIACDKGRTSTIARAGSTIAAPIDSAESVAFAYGHREAC